MGALCLAAVLPSSLPAKKPLTCQSFKMSWLHSPRARITARYLCSTHWSSVSFPTSHELFTISYSLVCLFWSLLSSLIRDICIPREMCTWFTYLFNPDIWTVLSIRTLTEHHDVNKVKESHNNSSISLRVMCTSASCCGIIKESILRQAQKRASYK